MPVVARRERGGARRRRAARRRARRDAWPSLHVIEVPLELPLDARAARGGGRRPTTLLDDAAGARRDYGVDVVDAARCARGSAGPRSSRRRRGGTPSSSSSARPARDQRPRRAVFGETVDYVLRDAPCRVMVAAGRKRAPREAVPARRSPSSRVAARRVGLAVIVRDAPRRGGGGLGFLLGALLRRRRRSAALYLLRPQAAPLAAGHGSVPGLERVLDAPVALLGRLRRDRARRSTSRSGSSRSTRSGSRPWVLLVVGAALPARLALVRRGHGGDPRDGRRGDVRPPRVQRPGRVPDRLGAVPRLPDRDRARGALRAALLRRRGRRGARSTDAPWDVVVAVLRRSLAIAARAPDPPAAALPRRARRRRASTSSTQLLLVVLGFALPLLAGRARRRASISAPRRRWHRLAFALPLAMLAYTGLETVANLAEETREPGRTLPRSLFVGDRRSSSSSTSRSRSSALSAFPADGRRRPRSARLAPRAAGRDRRRARRARCPAWLVDAAARVRRPHRRARSCSPPRRRRSPGFGRLAYSLGAARKLPRAFGRLRPAHARLAAGDRRRGRDLDRARRRSTAALGDDVAVPREPLQLRRAARVHRRAARGRPAALHRARAAAAVPRAAERPDPRRRRAGAALVGAPLTFAVWVVALATHAGARYAGPAWLALGARRLRARRGVRAATGCSSASRPPTSSPAAEAEFARILVPMKLGADRRGDARDRGQARQERGGDVEALHVIRVPLDLPLDAELLDAGGARRGVARRGEAARRRARREVERRRSSARARSARRSSRRRRRRRRPDRARLGAALAPPVALLLARPSTTCSARRPCEVMVVAYPQGVLEEARRLSSLSYAGS